jgi:SLT domain-containing protein
MQSIKYTHKHRPLKAAKQEWQEKDPTTIPIMVRNALHTAMRLEGIPETEYADLLWIMTQESGGKVGVRNSQGSSARGLFQLLRQQYELNPNGEKSFGNAIEECQGGIRYIIGRYHSAAAAKKFWQSHHWY